jgi:fructan beta-fructosidase
MLAVVTVTRTPAVPRVPPVPRLPDRPVVHATPPLGWMNDPNGLVHLDGEWHLCYQHHPDSLVWGPMHWGHAVSRDLLTWEHLPVALAPDEHGTIFSGSAVVDRAGTAGYGPDALLAFFTYHRDGDRGQALAWSLDAGRTWTKHAANPLVPAPGDGPDFRDPRVRRYRDPSGTAWWVMVVAAGQRLCFYRSDDLLDWTPTSTLTGLSGESLGVVETPELVEVDVDGATERAWILAFGHTTGGPQGGSGARYLVGRFDGERFTPSDDEVRWVDHGADLYALQAWSDGPDGRRIWVGWMSNWAYANEVPASTWRGMMSIPREVRLVRDGAGSLALAQRPVRELDARRTRLVELHEPELEAARSVLAGVRGPCLDVRLTLALPPEAAGELDLVVHVPAAGTTRSRGGTDGSRVDPTVPPAGTRIGYDAATRQVVVDRGRSGTPVAAGSPTVHRSVPLPAREVLDLRILTDTCSVEVFAAGGTVVLSDLVLAAPDATGIRIDRVPAGARILHLDVGRVDAGGDM